MVCKVDEDHYEDHYFTERFNGRSLSQILQAPRQHLDIDTIIDLADWVREIELVLFQIRDSIIIGEGLPSGDAFKAVDAICERAMGRNNGE